MNNHSVMSDVFMSLINHNTFTAMAELESLTDLVTPHVIRAAVTLNLPQLIAEGVCSLEALAERIHVDLRTLRSITAYLIHKGVLTQTSDGFGLTATGRLLATDEARFMLTSGGAWEELNRAWSSLTHVARTKTSGYQAEVGCSFWETLDRNPALSLSFNHYLEKLGAIWIPTAVAARDWGSGTHIVDVGGGAGQLLCAILTAYSNLEGSLVDLPASAQRARNAFATAQISDRTRMFEANFFEPLPVRGDVYILAQVLHDWQDHDAEKILRQCAQAAGSSGRVIVIDRVMEDHPSLPHSTFHLFMLMLFGSHERTLPEFEDLAACADLKIIKVQKIGLELSILEMCTQV